MATAGTTILLTTTPTIKDHVTPQHPTTSVISVQIHLVSRRAVDQTTYTIQIQITETRATVRPGEIIKIRTEEGAIEGKIKVLATMEAILIRQTIVRLLNPGVLLPSNLLSLSELELI
jgi:hypothetical protein